MGTRKQCVASAALGAFVVVMVGGCASSSLVGSWRGAESTPAEAPFEFAGVTFAPDRTYTAHMRYEDRELGETGEWVTHGNILELKENDRSYTYTLHGDEVTFTDEKGRSATLERIE